MTLVFLGAVVEHRLPDLRALADAVIATPFDLDMARLGCWRAQRLAWAAPHECPPALAALAGQLRDALRRNGFRIERRAFKPHVTLLRDVVTAPPARDLPAPLRWPVRGFVLVSSEPAPKGVQYRVIGRWPLGDTRL